MTLNGAGMAGFGGDIEASSGSAKYLFWLHAWS